MVEKADRKEIVSLIEVLRSEEYRNFKAVLPFVLGKDINGNMQFADLAKMPHMLVGGDASSGKSVFLSSIIYSLISRYSHEYLRLLLVDPKEDKLSVFGGIPHLLHPVVTDPFQASALLDRSLEEMQNRYSKMADMSVRNIESYNRKIDEISAGKRKRPAMIERHSKMPYLLIFIAELADLMIVRPIKVEESIARLAQMSRPVGIHLVVATKYANIDVTTGWIKANIESHICFKVMSKGDSGIILDHFGAEELQEAGEMLWLGPNSSHPENFKGPFLDEKAVAELADSLRQNAEVRYDPEFLRAAKSIKKYSSKLRRR